MLYILNLLSKYKKFPYYNKKVLLNYSLLKHSSRTMASKTVKFNNGREIPLVGLGTWLSPAGKVYEAVKIAINAGYRHIDCAFAYGNEEEVGRALTEVINEGVVTREELFITGKVWNTYHLRERVPINLEASLKNLGLDYLDLYLIHWPLGYGEGDVVFPRNENGEVVVSDIDFMDTWRGLEDAQRSGRVRSIGMSNFNSEQLDRVIAEGSIRPVLNQVECHPYLNQSKLLEFCRSRDIVLAAYSPLGSPERPQAKPDDPTLHEEPVIKQIASSHNVTTGQVLIRFQVQRGVVVVPKSVTKERIISNLDVFSFELTSEDMAAIESLNRNERLIHLRWNGPIVTAHKYYPFNIPF